MKRKMIFGKGILAGILLCMILTPILAGTGNHFKRGSTIDGKSAFHRSVEISPQAGFILPGQQYENSSLAGGEVLFRLSSEYILNLSGKFGNLTSESEDGVSTAFNILSVSMERNFKKLSREVESFSSFGIGKMRINTDDRIMFVFGVGFRFPLSNLMTLKFSLRDNMTELNIPFVSFPSTNVYVSGSGENFLEITMGLNFQLSRFRF